MQSNGNLMIELATIAINDYLTSSFYQFYTHVQKKDACIILVCNQRRPRHKFQCKNLVNAMLHLGDIKPGNKYVD